MGALGFRVELRLRILTNAGGIAYGVLARSLAGDATETPWKANNIFFVSYIQLLYAVYFSANNFKDMRHYSTSSYAALCT